MNQMILLSLKLISLETYIDSPFCSKSFQQHCFPVSRHLITIADFCPMFQSKIPVSRHLTHIRSVASAASATVFCLKRSFMQSCLEPLQSYYLTADEGEM